MERTIPVLRSLVAADSGDQRARANLGYALKEQRTPAWKAAEDELSKAIQARGDARTEGWTWYEFNRAICRIEVEGACAKGKASGLAERDAILADLMIAASVPRSA